MEAAKLQKKKTAISKGKLKKTIKNTLSRPDPVFWPLVSDEHAKQLESALSKHKISIPEFHKPHWSMVKTVPKESRPKAPKLEKVDGLLFGTTTCVKAINSGTCSAIILDGEINPRILVHHILDACSSSNIPMICLNSLRSICSKYFGIPTCCLGFDKESIPISDVRKKVIEISKNYVRESKIISNNIEVMDVDASKENKEKEETTIPFNYLYRKSKTARVFIPPAAKLSENVSKEFSGQDFIEFPRKAEEKNSKAYMSMIVKRITNNANRTTKS